MALEEKEELKKQELNTSISSENENVTTKSTNLTKNVQNNKNTDKSTTAKNNGNSKKTSTAKTSKEETQIKEKSPEQQNQIEEKIQEKQDEDQISEQAVPTEEKIQNETESKNEEEKQIKTETNNSEEIESKEMIEAAESFVQAANDAKSIKHHVLKIIGNIFFTFLAILALAFTIFTITNTNNSEIASGVSILGIDVSGLDKTSAMDKITNHLIKGMENDILLKHNDFETNIGPEQLEVKFNVENTVDAAFDVGSGSNIFSNSFKKLALIVKPVDITPEIAINNEQLESALSVISTQLPDAVVQSDYYIDGGNLVVTSGKPGVIIDIPSMKNEITAKLNDLSFINNPIEIATISQNPIEPDIEKIYNEIHKNAQDARFDAETHIVYPEESGLDFNISLDEAKGMFNNKQEEYIIPLKVLYPSITTNMIGMEAFPNLLSSFSTKYPASNKGRTTNLKLAASKIDGTVLLPGQEFSYNSVVGERTIAAGYKEAAIYQDGEVTQGLGGGICQISTTLYNAALYSNLEILERRNHQFVPSYIGAGRHATVVYGSQDFKFKNNRNYAIKIVCSVEGGVASFDIYGISEPDDYEVVITSGITSRNSGSFTSATYKTLKQNGETVSSEVISRDTYKSH